MTNNGSDHGRFPLIAAVCGIVCLLTAVVILDFLHILPGRIYRASDFGIETAISGFDFNRNGVDDYADFLEGALIDARNHPVYNGAYYDGGFPPDDIGVCTDVIWRAFKQAGYNLREMVDEDICRSPADYPAVVKRDKNIDFRRVPNLAVFFTKYGQILTLDPLDISSWQPGDIVIFEDGKHIGMISDKRNSSGIAYVIHNSGQLNREEDYLQKSEISGHYRFDASKVNSSILIPWTQQEKQNG